MPDPNGTPPNGTALATRAAATPARRDTVPTSYSEAMQVGAVLARSGYFTDARKEAEAAAKVIAGMELGIGPMASMTGIHIVKGKVTLSANLIGALILRSGKYRFRVTELEPEAVELAFYEGAEELGRSRFTKADAVAAGLWGSSSPWKQHPRNMLYARSMSNGAKWFTPDVFAGPVYTPDELGANVDGATGEVIAEAGPPADEPVTPTASAEDLAAVVSERLRELRGDLTGDALAAILKAAGIANRAELADDETFARARAAVDAATGDEPEGDGTADTGGGEPEPPQDGPGGDTPTPTPPAPAAPATGPQAPENGPTLADTIDAEATGEVPDPGTLAAIPVPEEGTPERERAERRLAPLMLRLDGDRLRLAELCETLGMQSPLTVHDDRAHDALGAAVKAEQAARDKKAGR